MQPDQFKLHADIEDIHWWFTGRRCILRALVHQLVAPSKSRTIVDVGCGTGGNIAAFACDYTCVGIDTSAEAIRFATRRFPDIHFICGSTPADLKGITGRADLVLLTDVLEHIEDDATFLFFLLTALKPGTHILLTVPADMALWSDQDTNHNHYRRYDRQGLERLWSGLPVTVRLLSYFNTYLYPAVRFIRTLNRIRGRTWGEAGTDLKVPARPMNRLLADIFASERKALVELLEKKRTRGYPFGVSLIAVLCREA